MSELRLVFCTFPDVDQARRIGRILIEERLAACVNLLPQVESIYHWQGAVETSAEVLCIFKTVAQRYPAFEERLRLLHPYEVPEILALTPAAVSSSYAGWLLDAVLSGVH